MTDNKGTQRMLLGKIKRLEQELDETNAVLWDTRIALDIAMTRVEELEKFNTPQSVHTIRKMVED